MASSGPRRHYPAAPPPGDRLSLLKYLQGRGVDSRRRIMEAIIGGQVRVNGTVVRDSVFQIDLARDQVHYGQVAPDTSARQPVYLVMNKPAGVLTTTRDERGRRTVLDLLPARLRGEHIFPVGRLDADTEGLLLLTNDGELAQRLAHPSYEVEKEYRVVTAGPVPEHELRRLRNGIRLEEGVTAPASVRHLGEVLDGYAYALSIHEGKKRQVRRMFQAIGHPVLSLTRTRVKDLQLGTLRPGEVRALTARELRSLRA